MRAMPKKVLVKTKPKAHDFNATATLGKMKQIKPS